MSIIQELLKNHTLNFVNAEIIYSIFARHYCVQCMLYHSDNPVNAENICSIIILYHSDHTQSVGYYVYMPFNCTHFVLASLSCLTFTNVGVYI